MRRLLLTMRLPLIAVVALLTLVGPASGVTGPPEGVTALALDGRVQLTWQPVSGADEYRVYRGASAATTDQLVSAPGLSGTTFTDTGAANGQDAYYVVRAVSGGEESPVSGVAGATPRAASCGTGNAIVRENCFPGSVDWKVDPGSQASNSGIEGFASQPSIDAGQSVDLKVNTGAGIPYRVEIYRTGWYGGSQGRLIGTLEGLAGVDQPACPKATDGTGLRSCSNWSVSARISTSASWPSGVYLLKLTRADNGKANQILLTVRDDDGGAKVLYNLPDATYQSYNNYGGKSVYPGNSSGDLTVAGTTQAVKVSWDRPYQQTASRQRDFYTFTDLAAVSWLERQGYSVAYSSSVDMQRGIPGLTGYSAIVIGSHHEYWSAEMRGRITAARDAGVNVLSISGNGMYWKTRYDDGERTQVVYKSTATGVDDPSGIPTGTWRDPVGANRPENEFLGSMYVGDNDSTFFPLKVTAAQGTNPVWRYTAAAGGAASFGKSVTGWEWDAPVDNGRQPAGLQVLSSSPVTGNLLTDAGGVYAPGSTSVSATLYRAAGGARVFNAGTNHWARGLALNSRGIGDVHPAIQQATANLLADMGVQPTTPNGITLDPTGPPSIASTTPADGATSVAVGTTVRALFDRALDPATVDGGALTLRRTSDGAAVAAQVTYDSAARAIVLTPNASLATATGYTATVAAGVRDVAGNTLTAPVSWSFSTAAPGAPKVTDRSPASGATGVATGTTVSATFDIAMDATTIDAGTVRLLGPGGTAVAASVAYAAGTRTVTLTPNAALAAGTAYTARLETGIRSQDGVALAAAESWGFTTQPGGFTVTARVPAPLSTGVTLDTPVQATFSRDADPATVTASTFTLTDGAGTAVPATVGYDAANRRATLQPSAALTPLTSYTASLSSGVTAADGQALTASTWTFQTSATATACPCSLFEGLAPAITNASTRDSRPLPGPWTRELGVKIEVTRPTQLTAIRYYRASQETGAHVGRLWTAGGSQLASVTFSGGTASGWQEQALATPLDLVPGQVYVVSVGFNTKYSATQNALGTAVVDGPVRTVADGANGVYSDAAGTFPTTSYRSSNYFVDLVAR